MSWGPKQVFSVAIASGASTSSSLDLGDKSYRQMATYYGTMSTGAALTVYGSTDGTNFYPAHERVNTAPVQYQALTIATSTSGAWAVFAAPPFRYVQFVASAVVSGGVALKVAVDD